MTFNTTLLMNNDILYQQLKSRYGYLILEEYPYQIVLRSNNQYIELFSEHLLYDLFPEELIEDTDIISRNNFNNYMIDNRTNIFLHDIDAITKLKLKQNLITRKDNNRYIVNDLIEDIHFIIPNQLLKKYNVYLCYLNGEYVLLTKYEKVHKYFLSLEAKDLLKKV